MKIFNRQILDSYYPGIILCIIPGLLVFLFIYLFGINVCYYDQFFIVPLFSKLFSGTLNFSDLWGFQNEHIVFFPKIIMLVIGVLTHYNNVAEMYFTGVLLIISFSIFLFVAKRQFGFKIKTIPLWLVPISFLTFSWIQKEILLWGFGLALVFVQTMALTTFYLIYLLAAAEKIKTIFIYFLLIIAAASITTFSSSHGLLVWIAGCLQLLISSIERPKKVIYIITFSIIGLIEWLFFFYNFGNSGNSIKLNFLDHPVQFIEFLLVCMGGPLSHYQIQALAAGIIIAAFILATLLLLIKYRRVAVNSFWISVIVFSLSTIFCIAIYRWELGVWQALASRYTTFSLLSTAALYVLFIDLSCVEKRKIPVYMGMFIGMIIMASVIFSYSYSLKTQNLINQENAFILYTFDTQPDECLGLFLFPFPIIEKKYHDEVKKDAIILKGLSYNVFSSHSLCMKYPEISNLVERPSNVIVDFDILGFRGEKCQDCNQDSGGFIVIEGWAYNKQEKDIVGGVYIDIDGNIFPSYYGKFNENTFPSYYAKSRNDIHGNIPNFQMYYSGFRRAISKKLLGKGTHVLSFKILSKDRKNYCSYDKKTTFVIK